MSRSVDDAVVSLKQIVTDRGLNNRGVFVIKMSAAGVYCGNIGLEALSQIGKV